MDGISLGQITPGPIVNVSTFVGYQVAGVSGAVLAALSVFLPAFLFIIGAAAGMDWVRQSPQVQAFLRGINAAVVGAILGATVPLARGAIVDLFSALVAIAVLALQWRYRVATPWVVVAAGAVGLVVTTWAGR